MRSKLVGRMFFDFHVNGDLKLAQEAKKFGYSGVCLVYNSSQIEKQPEIHKKLKNLKRQVKIINDQVDFSDQVDSNEQAESDYHVDSNDLAGSNNSAGSNDSLITPSIYVGVEIFAKNPQDLKNKVQKYRKRADIILVHGGNLKINRAASEDPRVDILCNPYNKRWDSGVNHVLAVKAHENRVAMELNLKYLIMTRPNQRYKVLSQFRQIKKLQHKYNFPVIITSGADSLYGLRDPRDIIALAKCFGMNKEEATSALQATPQEMINRNKIRDEVVIPGVRLINEK